MNPSYNGFRAFAFLAVFFFHAKVLNAGYLGVQAFFVLSSFLITPILVDTKNNSSNFKNYLKNFLTRRILRIFPLYYGYLISIAFVIIIFGLAKHEYFASLQDQLIYGFTYTYNFYHQTTNFEHNQYLTHFWSLAIEEQFYLFWPLIIYFTSKDKLKYVLILLIVLGPLIRFLTPGIIDAIPTQNFNENKNLIVYLSTFSYLDAFAIGGLFSLFINYKFKSFQIVIVIFFTIIIGYVFSFITVDKIRISSLGYPAFMSDSYKYIWGYTLLSFCFGLILLKMKSRSFFPKIFENKVLIFMGLISYGLYVFHYGVLHMTSVMLKFIGIPNISIIRIPLALMLTIGISYLSYFFMEKKFIALKDKIAPKMINEKNNT